MSILIATAIFGAAASTVQAAQFVLTDENSTASILTDDDHGVFSWVVDGVEHISRQWFWYRIGDDPESSVVSLPIEQEVASNTDLDPGDDTLFVRYGNDAFDIEIRLGLDGGLPGSGASDLGEQISIHNRGESPLDFHFFQYTDFDINGTADFDEVYFANDNSVRQSDGEGLLLLTETVITPVPSHRQADFFSIILDLLRIDGMPTDLNDTPAEGVVLGPGDMTWAYQWDVVIDGGGTFQISKDKNLKAIPEPSTAVLAFIALGTLVFIGRRRSS